MKDLASTADGDADECPWCKFMKGGPCRTVFETWQACVDGVMDSPADAADEQSRRVAVESCAAVTAPLFECLVKHPEYYGPQLDTMADRSRSENEAPNTTAAAAAAAAATVPAAATAGSSSVSQSSKEAGSRGSNSGTDKASSTAAAGPGREAKASESSSSVATGNIGTAVA